MADLDKNYAVTLKKDSIEIETPTQKLVIKSEVGTNCTKYEFIFLMLINLTETG